MVFYNHIDGFYNANPRENKNAVLLKEVEEITPELEECAGGAGTSLGTGGMITKLNAAKLAAKSGVDMILANGAKPEILLDIIQGKEVGTLFKAKV